MPKPSSNFSAEVNRSTSSPRPQTSETPAITSSGTLAWNVRDILFGSNRSATDTTERRPKPSKE
jgi:hypothetical protein